MFSFNFLDLSLFRYAKIIASPFFSFHEASIMNQIEIAQTFSLGQLNQTFKYFSVAIVWDIVGEKKLIGQADVIAECIQVQHYFNSVQHDFKID